MQDSIDRLVSSSVKDSCRINEDCHLILPVADVAPTIDNSSCGPLDPLLVSTNFIDDYRADNSFLPPEVYDSGTIDVFPARAVESEAVTQSNNWSDDDSSTSSNSSSIIDEINTVDVSTMNLSKNEKTERDIILHRCQTSNPDGCLLRRGAGNMIYSLFIC